MKRISFLIFFIFSLSAKADPNFSVMNWYEEVDLDASGRSARVVIRGKAENLERHQVMTAFAMSFGSKDAIEIDRVICDDALAKFSFRDNILKVMFPQPKTNDQIGVIEFYYKEKYSRVNNFLRQEAILIPASAAGAQARITINFPGYLESATFNPSLTKIGNSFVYNRIVPQEGVTEIIKLTEARSAWDVAVKVKVVSNNPLKNVAVIVPIYFQNPRQEVENYTTFASVKPAQQKTVSVSKVFNFNSEEREIEIVSKARIITGSASRHTEAMRVPGNYMKFSEEESALLSQVVNQIKQNPNYGDLPFYVKVGKFVNEFIKYDSSYIGKLPTLKEILRNPVGVCTEYARLYDALMRIAGVPSLVIYGAACGEYEKCQGHSWNMIYYDNRWIEVDPTWNLMSGIVSSSHVYFKDSNREDALVQYLKEQGAVQFSVEFAMKQVDDVIN